jgi:uncharacterized coiled-coil protein SlyX
MSIATDNRVQVLEGRVAEQQAKLDALTEEVKALRAKVESKGKARG